MALTFLGSHGKYPGLKMRKTVSVSMLSSGWPVESTRPSELVGTERSKVVFLLLEYTIANWSEQTVAKRLNTSSRPDEWREIFGENAYRLVVHQVLQPSHFRDMRMWWIGGPRKSGFCLWIRRRPYGLRRRSPYIEYPYSQTLFVSRHQMKSSSVSPPLTTLSTRTSAATSLNSSADSHKEV